MVSKILFFIVTAAAFCSCSTAYKSGQTPDDVYYSPARPVYETSKSNEEWVSTEDYNQDRQIRMGILDRRWRYMDYDYGYSYYNSPYNYFYNTCTSCGYYYNPYYSSCPVYYPVPGKPRVVIINPVNTKPRMVNLNAYSGYNSNTYKNQNNINWRTRSGQYNNSNQNRGVGNRIRRVISPSSSNDNSSRNANDSRSYSPSSGDNGSSNRSSGNSSSSGSGSVTRPGRGN